MRDDAEELSDALDLEYWAEREGLDFKMARGRSGMQLNFRACPECGDRRYRTYLNAETGVGNCFVCGEIYSKLKFINIATGLSWADTFRHVKEVLIEQGWRPKRKHSVAVENTVKLPVSFELPTPSGQNLQYLENRGFTADIAKYFHLRYCVSGWWNFTNEDGRPSGQKFDGRVIIPVYDLDGTLHTFQGRDITGTSEKKYLFPQGLPGTGRYIYNGHNFVRSKRVLMGEGAFDVAAQKIAMEEDPTLRDVVPIGSFGKHLSFGDLAGNDQLGRLLQMRRAGLEELTIMWDGEPKALIAALDAAKLTSRIGIRTRIALLPLDKDPNEVPAHIVRKAFYEAKTYTSILDIQWRLRNPFAA